MSAYKAMRERRKCTPVEDLLPGIVDDIVLHEIVPNLQWKDVYTLSSVSFAWYNAIRSRQVLHLRASSRSSETLVPVYYTRTGDYTCNTIALFSMGENSWHKLPLIAEISRGQHEIPALGQCVSLDGKIYVLGGAIHSEISNKVFVFDLAGEGRWEECASMKERRLDFGSAVIAGKIYVFGGKTGATLNCSVDIYGRRYDLHEMSTLTLISGSEVYDPMEDTWSPITPMKTCGFGQDVTPVGEEIFVYGGWAFDLARPPPRDGRGSLDAYHPFKDEWRVLQHPWNRPWDSTYFTAEGIFFSIQADYAHENLQLDPLVIHKYDVHGNSWSHVQSFSFTALIPVEYGPVRSFPDVVLAVDGELIALVSFREMKGQRRWRLCLFQSTGFASENQKFSWKLRAITFEELEGVPNYFVQRL